MYDHPPSFRFRKRIANSLFITGLHNGETFCSDGFTPGFTWDSYPVIEFSIITSDDVVFQYFFQCVVVGRVSAVSAIHLTMLPAAAVGRRF